MDVESQLKKAIETFKQRNKEYGNTYKEFGAVLKSFFPEGITLEDKGDFARFAIFLTMASKLKRYAQNMEDGHSDSLLDLSVYSAMLNEIDTEGL